MKNIGKFISHLKDRVRLDRKSYRVYVILRVLIIAAIIRHFISGSYEEAAICVLALVLLLLPSFAEETLKVEIPPLFESLIYLFIFSAEILGEVNQYYTRIPGWDTMLHTINGFLCAVVGFSLVDILNRKSSHVNLSPAYLAIAAFCFSMTVGVLWEFFEFGADHLFQTDMQKDFVIPVISSTVLDPNHSQTPFVISDIVKTTVTTQSGQTYVINGGYLDIGIIDTMKDLFVNFIGAVTFSIIGYFYIKNRGKKDRKKSIADRLLLRVLTDEEAQEKEEEIDEEKRRKKEHRRQISSDITKKGHGGRGKED